MVSAAVIVGSFTLALAATVIEGSKVVDDFVIPIVPPDGEEHFICKAWKMPTDQQRIFITNASFPTGFPMRYFHHIRLVGCAEVFSETGTWSCKDKLICEGKAYSSLPVEGMDGQRDFYPPDAGYELGDRNEVRYLVASVHYNVNAGTDETFDKLKEVKVRLEYQTKPTAKLIGSLDIATNPLQKSHPLDSPPGVHRSEMVGTCYMRESVKITPFHIHYHTHAHGTRMEIIKVEGLGSNTHVSVIGEAVRKDSKTYLDPEMQDFQLINPADRVIVKCVYEMTGQDSHVHIGKTSHMEMCDAVLYYVTEGDKVVEKAICETLESIVKFDVYDMLNTIFPSIF